MRKTVVAIILFLSLQILSSTCAPAQTLLMELQKEIDATVKGSQVTQSASVGIFIKALKSGEIIYEKNANMPLTPASNLKILTSAAAFALLGPDYTYKTYVYGGPIDPSRGVMESSLYLVGSGDPTFVEPFVESPTIVFESFAEKLFAMGLRKVQGDLVGDDTIFDRDFVGKGWKARYILDNYACECGGLALNGNLLQLIINPGRVETFPESPEIPISNRAVAGGYTELKVERENEKILISGVIGYGDSRQRLVPVHNPPLFTLSSFGRILLNHNIYVTGHVRLIEPQPYKYSYKKFIPLCVSTSPKLLDVLKVLNKESDNFLAQQVFRTLGAVVMGKGTRENSEAAVKKFLEKVGVETTGLEMADGCGLSTLNRVTPRQIVEVLDYMYCQPEGKKFISTLPRAGIDGTLKYRLYNTSVFAKTGTINENSSLSGYVVSGAGQMMVFSIITNNGRNSAGFYKDLEDRIVYTLARWNKQL